MSTINYHKLGTPEYPIPIMSKEGNITWLASEEDAVFIPTMRTDTTDEIYGRFIRDVVTDPCMMESMTEIILRLDKTRTPPESKSFSYTVQGDPGNGKTYLVKQIASLVHPKGAFVVDCNNIKNTDELFKITSFSVDQARKQKLIDAHFKEISREEDRTIADATLEYCRNMFGDQNVYVENRDDRQIVSIDWNAIQEDATFIERACDKILELEGIPYQQDTNSVGFVTTNGPLLQALIDPNSPDFGRPILLDESNRAPEVDAWLQIEAFLSEPGARRLRLPGADDRDYVINREDIPDNFMCLSTCNAATEDMGLSAKEMSRPMISRKGMGIDIFHIPSATKEDYISRTLKHLTGVPAYHFYSQAPSYFDAHPEELARILMHARKVGLTKEEEKLIPQEEIHNIKHIDRTFKAALSYGTLLYETNQLIQKLSTDESLPEQYLEYLRSEAVVDLRYAFKVYQHSKIATPKVESKSTPASVFAKIGVKEDMQTQADITHETIARGKKRQKDQLLYMGTQLERELGSKLSTMLIPANIQTMLKDSPDPQADLEKIKQAWVTVKHIAKNLKFEFADYVGEDSFANTYNARPEEVAPEKSVDEARDILMASIGKEHGLSLSKETFDIDALNDALASLVVNDKQIGHIVALNHEVDAIIDPIKRVGTIARTSEDLVNHEAIDPSSLITARQLIDGMMIKKMRDYNIAKLSQEPVYIPKEVSDTVREILTGNHDTFFTTAVMVRATEKDKTGETKDKPGVAHVIYNKVSGKTLIAGDFDIPDTDREKLKENQVFFVNITKLDEEKDAEIITNYVDQNIVGSNVTTTDICDAIMVRADTDLIGLPYENDAKVRFWMSLPTLEREQLQFVALTNKEYQIEQLEQEKASGTPRLTIKDIEKGRE